MNEYNFIEFIQGGFSHSKGKNDFIIPTDNVKNFEGKKDCFVSSFRFSEDFKKFFQQFKTTSGYGGAIAVPSLILDFDCEGNVEKAKAELEAFIEHGLQEFLTFEEIENFVRISFSGCKGFGLAIPAGFLGKIEPHADNHIFVKAFVRRMTHIASDSSGVNFETIDFAIYDRIRLTRLSNTINSKSGLYKIPLSYSEFLKLSVDEIKELAKGTRNVKYGSNRDIKVNQDLRNLFLSIVEDVKAEPKAFAKQEETETAVNFGAVQQGKRNETIFRNANYLRYKNIPYDTAIEILKLQNSMFSVPLGSDEIKTTVSSAYNYTTREEIKSDNLFEFQDFEQRLSHYENYIRNIQSKKVKLGFPLIDETLRGLRPGNLCTLLAGTGIGKSAIAQNILMNYTKTTSELSVFFSLEMAAEEIFERELSLELDLTGFAIENAFLMDPETIKERCKIIASTQNNFITVTKRVDIDFIISYIQNIEEIVGKKAGFICIDYLALLKNSVFPKDEYLRLSDNMIRLKEIAKRLEIPILVLSQVARSEIKSEKGISLYSGKGSGEVENSSDIILSLEKSTEQPPKNNIDFLNLSILKNRRGGYGKIIIEFNRNNLKMTESDLNNEPATIGKQPESVDITF